MSRFDKSALIELLVGFSDQRRPVPGQLPTRRPPKTIRYNRFAFGISQSKHAQSICVLRMTNRLTAPADIRRGCTNQQRKKNLASPGNTPTAISIIALRAASGKSKMCTFYASSHKSCQRVAPLPLSCLTSAARSRHTQNNTSHEASARTSCQSKPHVKYVLHTRMYVIECALSRCLV